MSSFSDVENYEMMARLIIEGFTADNLPVGSKISDHSGLRKKN